MNDLNPFDGNNLPTSVNAGSVAVEQERAIAEARGQIQLAKMFPRSIIQASEELAEACKDPAFAAEAFYTVPNRGSGPSIRFAEEIARCYGNFEYGHRELSRSDGKSEVEVYAWDKEKNNYSRRQITVNHIMDTRQGPRKLTSEADIDNRIANVAAKQMRGRILALVSKTLVANGIAECKATLAGGGEKTIRQRIGDMVKAFAPYGVKTALLETYLGHKLDDATADDLADLRGVYNALKAGARVADYFQHDEPEKPALPDSGTESALGAVAKEKSAEAKAKAEAKPEPKAEPKAKPKASAAKKEPEPDPKPEPDQNNGDDDVDLDSLFGG
jgi:hypothetical protein